MGIFFLDNKKNNDKAILEKANTVLELYDIVKQLFDSKEIVHVCDKRAHYLKQYLSDIEKDYMSSVEKMKFLLILTKVELSLNSIISEFKEEYVEFGGVFH